MNPTTSSNREKEIFEQALDLESGAERQAFVKGACGADAVLCARVLALLAAHETDTEFLAEAPAGGTVVMPVTEQAGDRIGRYRLREKIGEGGCGLVYVAEQEEPVRRRVALKVIKLGMDTREVVARFEAERQALALMDHPNIARVFDGGATETGRPYFVLELVRGVRITDYCDQHHLPTVERLKLFVQVCHAIQHAHQKGIIHRDIKPSNILVSLHDDVPLPKVIDFGIAKAIGERLTEQTIYTRFEQFMGTPAYMSPEQAGRSDLDIDTRSDIYALGVLLYELLAGRPPFDPKQLAEAGLEEMVRCIREQEPLRPSTRLSKLQQEELTTTAQRRGTEPPRLIGQLRGDLDWIVMKCLEKNRARRYETANGLARDVEAYLSHEPVAARPPSTAYRVGKFVRRNKVMVSAAAAVAAALLIGMVGSSWQAVRATRAERQQSRERQRAEQNEQKAIAAQAKETDARKRAYAQAYSAEMNLAQQAYEEGNVARAQALLEKHLPGSGQQDDLRGFEWRYLRRLCERGDALRTVRVHTNPVFAVALSADARLVTCALEGATKILDVATGRELASFQAKDKAKMVAVSANGEVIAAGFGNGIVKCWRPGASQAESEIPENGKVSTLALSPDGRTLAIACTNRVRLWDVAEQREAPALPWTNSSLYNLTFSPDGRLLASGCATRVILWNVSDGRELEPLENAHSTAILAVALSPDGRTLATCSWDTTIRLWDLASRRLLATLSGHRAAILALAFSPDGPILATCGRDDVVKLWDVGGRTNAAPRATLKGHLANVCSLAFSPGGKMLASGSWDGAVNLWPVATQASPDLLQGHTDWAFSLAISPDDQTLASAGFDGTIRLWDLKTGAEKSVTPVSPYDIFTVAFSPDGATLATAEGRWRAARAANATTPALARLRPVANPGQVLGLSGGDPNARDLRAAVFSPDGKTLAVCGGAGVKFWSLPEGREASNTNFQPHAGHLTSALQFSPDGRYLATTAWGDNAKLWNAATLGEIPLADDGQDFGCGPNVAFSPDGSILATCSSSTRREQGSFLAGEVPKVKLWSVPSGRSITVLEGHQGVIMCVRFSPDGKTLATGSADHSVKLWNLATHQEVATLQGHTAAVSGVAFSSDGTILASSGDDRTIRLWRAISVEEMARVRRTNSQ